MDRKLRKILTECIRDVETRARDVEGCLQRHPERAAELRPHLELWSGLDAAAKAEPNFGSQQRGQHQLLGALADLEKRGDKRMIPALVPAVAKVAAVVAGVALLAGGSIGASAALGGPDVAGEVLSGIGISNASDTGKEHANPNAFDGADNARQGIDNASDTGREHANPDAPGGANNAGQGANNANPNALENGGDALDNDDDDAADADDVPDGGDVADDVIPDDGSPDSTPAADSAELPDSVPEGAPVPDSVPVGPQP